MVVVVDPVGIVTVPDTVAIDVVLVIDDFVISVLPDPNSISFILKLYFLFGDSSSINRSSSR